MAEKSRIPYMLWKKYFSDSLVKPSLLKYVLQLMRPYFIKSRITGTIPNRDAMVLKGIIKETPDLIENKTKIGMLQKEAGE